VILLRLIGRRSFPQSALRRFILNERRVSSARNARWCPSQSSAAQDQLSRCSLNILTILTIMYPIYCYVLCIVSNGVLALHLIIRCWCGSWYFRRRCRRGFVCWCWWCLCCRRDGISFTCDAFGKRCSPPAEPAFLRFSHCKQMAEEGEKKQGEAVDEWGQTSRAKSRENVRNRERPTRSRSRSRSRLGIELSAEIEKMSLYYSHLKLSSIV